jgi:hypothetical protein
VSPKNVVVAGRVSAGAVDEGEVWVVEELCPADVPEVPLCAFALADRASIATPRKHPTVTRLTIVDRLQSTCAHALLHAARRRGLGCWGRSRLGRYDQTAATAAAYLTALAARITRFVRSPFMSRALFVCGAATLAGNLALLLR